jgi:RNA polymerase sigma factor (sigma-70 family)
MTSGNALVSTERNVTARSVGSSAKPRGGDDLRLVTAAKRGHAGAFDALCQPLTKVLFLRTYRITRNREDAEDAVQDSLLRAFLHIRTFDGRSRFSTWITRIAINSALMVLRKKRSSREAHLEIPMEAGADMAEWEAVDQSANPEESYAQREMEFIVRTEIRDLRPTIRETFELQKLQECSMKETAGKMGISVAAAKARLHHGKAALRKAVRLRTRTHCCAQGHSVRERCGLQQRTHGLPLA